MAAAATTSEQRRSLLTLIDMGARESAGNPQDYLRTRHLCISTTKKDPYFRIP